MIDVRGWKKITFMCITHIIVDGKIRNFPSIFLTQHQTHHTLDRSDERIFHLLIKFSLLLVSVFLSSRNHPHIMFGFFFVQLINLEIFSSFLPRYRSLIRRSSRKTKQQIANAGTNVDDCSIQ